MSGSIIAAPVAAVTGMVLMSSKSNAFKVALMLLSM